MSGWNNEPFGAFGAVGAAQAARANAPPTSRNVTHRLGEVTQLVKALETACLRTEALSRNWKSESRTQLRNTMKLIHDETLATLLEVAKE